MTFRSFPVRTAAAVGLLAAIAMLLARQPARTDEPHVDPLENAYQAEIRPLLARYCHDCHSGDLTEGQIDFEAFGSFADVRKRPSTWQKVAEMLDMGQMPPEDASQPTEGERTRLRQWVGRYLAAEAQARDGDPGRVVLRRLSNAQYTHTIRDLTGVDSLAPAREFPVDGAAGEGFTNTGSALVMSPALVTKYLDAAKQIAGHAVLLPDGMRFSPHATRPDWTNQSLAQIKEFYGQFVNDEGRVPLERYLSALLDKRAGLAGGAVSIEQIAAARGLNARYLGTLWTALSDGEPSLLLDRLRASWRDATPADVPALAGQIAEWQKALWRFQNVGHMKNWQEPVDPVVERQEIRYKIPAAADHQDVTLYLVVGDAGDGGHGDVVVWQQPRLVAPGRPDLLLRDVREVTRELTSRRELVFASAARCLSAAAEAAAAQRKSDVPQLALEHGVEALILRAWLDYLGIGAEGEVSIQGHFTSKLESAAGYGFVQGWGSHDTPLLLANSSDQHVRIPGNMRPHGVAVHPSPTLEAVVGWQSPIAATIRVEGNVTHAHPECGNGVTWKLELRRGVTRQRLATGTAQGETQTAVGPIEKLAVLPGDVVSLLIGPRDQNHACDLTAVDLKLTSNGDGGRTWNLADDVSSDILAGNPHADRFGNQRVWHFYTEPVSGQSESGPVIPAGSLLAQWQSAERVEDKQQLAEAVQKLLASGPPAAKDSPDAALYRQLASLGGPLLAGARHAAGGPDKPPAAAATDNTESMDAGRAAAVGLDPALFGRHPNGAAADAASLCVEAPSIIEVRLPAELVAGCELVTAGVLDPSSGADGTVQLQVLAAGPQPNIALSPALPILANGGSAARNRVQAALDEFRGLFPAAMCYTRIVPVDEVVTLTLFHREDQHLGRLMLDDAQRAELDRLWAEMHFISHDALTIVDAFEQIMEYATQDSDPSKIEPFRKPINERAAAFRQSLIDAQPRHLEALLDFAARAYRRPLTEADAHDLHALYARLRDEEIDHDDAIRLTLARVLVAPAFLYLVEKPGPGAQQSPVSDWELAGRLSYFLWSSLPDAELRELAAAGRLGDPDALAAQARRMLRDARARRLATEFACQWLHIHDFENLDEKSESHFPTFAHLRGAMYEESIQFFTDLFQNDGSVLDILDADYTFLNEELAGHYGIPGVSGDQWRRVEGVKQFSRGGILAQATTLSKQSGASRTSPILRGNWVTEVLLGERLPRPPKDVPTLPDDEAATEGLTVRELVERHSSDPKCAVCHRRMDPYGHALEGFDAIGRRRDKDLGDRPVDTRVTTIDGAEFDGLDGLRGYLLTVRRDAFVRQFCRKLLGFALGRAVQLSDEPLLAEMQTELEANDYRFATAVEIIVRSRQFREIRGVQTVDND